MDLSRLAVPTRYRRSLEIVLLVLIVVSGVLFRLDDLRFWRQNPELAFYRGQPLPTTYDAWFYLSLAQDLLEHEYRTVDERRGVPDSPDRPRPPPLLSVMAAGLVKVTHYSLGWIGAILPVLLAPLLAIPLYLLGRNYGGPLTGLVAALLSVLSPFYILRTDIGRFDTDSLNVTLPALAALFFLYFGKLRGRRRYLHLAAGLLVYGLFLWWWDQAPEVVSGACLVPLGIALAFFYRPPKTEALKLYGALGAAVVVALIVAGPEAPLRVVRGLAGKVSYIPTRGDDFPSTGVAITELARPGPERILRDMTGFDPRSQPSSVIRAVYYLPLLASFVGIGLTCRRRFRESLFLLPFLALAALAFFAVRFLIFLVPIYALGVGACLAALWNGSRRLVLPRRVACATVILLLVVPLYARMRSKNFAWPKEPARVVAGMDQARRSTPDDAVIWASWEHGYALNYYARRATVTDGSIQHGERFVYSALPLATDSPRMAANFMRFFVVRGERGMRLLRQACGNDAEAAFTLVKAVSGAGPERAESLITRAHLQGSDEYRSTADWLRFFFPEEERPVFLFLDERTLLTAYWWYWFGTWDVAARQGQHSMPQVFQSVTQQNGHVKGSLGLDIDIASGTLQVSQMNLRADLSGLAAFVDGKQYEKDYDRAGGPFFGVVAHAGFGMLVDAALARSVFGMLFIRQRHDARYFQPVTLNLPDYQLWMVRGDRLGALPDS